jgi:lipopolysaccharide exporter
VFSAGTHVRYRRGEYCQPDRPRRALRWAPALALEFQGMWLPGFLKKYADFISHVATMISGRAVAALIGLATTPIVARLFDPSEFGVAAVFMSIIGIVSNVGPARYDAAIVLPKREQDAVEIMWFCYRIVPLIGLVVLSLILIYKAAGFGWPTLELLGIWLWVLPFAAMLQSAVLIQEAWLTRKRSFGLISSSYVAGTASVGTVRIGFGLATGSTVYGLMIGNLLGLIARYIYMELPTATRSHLLSSRLSWARAREIGRHYSDFPKFNAPAALVFSAGQNLPVLLFGVMFSPAAAGLYAMANRLVQPPVSIVANSMRQVFRQKAAAVHNSGRSLKRAFLFATGGLALLGLIPFSALWLIGEQLAQWILGPRWLGAGAYLEIIALWLYMIWVMAPCNAIFVVLRRQKLWLTVQTLLTVLRFGAFGVSYAIGAGPEWTLRAFVYATVAGHIVTMMNTLWIISQEQTREPK